MKRFIAALCTATCLLLPVAAVSASDFDGKPVNGTVLQTMNSGGYTYLQIQNDQGEVWAAIPETKVEKGQKVTCLPGMEMQDFSSKTLNRTFASILFSPGLQGSAQAASMSPHGKTPKVSPAAGNDSFAQALADEQKPSMGAGAAPIDVSAPSTGSTGAIVPSEDVKVEKAEGKDSYTVGECFAKAEQLNNTTVMVRGKVMKVSQMIMGRNWVHLQDGTGSAMQNTHDLVVTTQEIPEKGSVVTFTGTLHANRDFGAGYKYAAIIEEATIQ